MNTDERGSERKNFHHGGNPFDSFAWAQSLRAGSEAEKNRAVRCVQEINAGSTGFNPRLSVFIRGKIFYVSAESGVLIDSRDRCSARTPMKASTTAAAIIRNAPARYPRKSAVREPVWMSRPKMKGAATPPTSVPAA